MIKLLMKWDIKPGRETAYLEFVSQKFTPGLVRLGLELSEVWYTYWGEGPHILMGFIARDMEAMRKVLGDSRWERTTRQLEDYVFNFQYKLVNAAGSFQL